MPHIDRAAKPRGLRVFFDGTGGKTGCLAASGVVVQACWDEDPKWRVIFEMAICLRATDTSTWAETIAAVASVKSIQFFFRTHTFPSDRSHMELELLCRSGIEKRPNTDDSGTKACKCSRTDDR